jgi:hypothetical protein
LKEEEIYNIFLNKTNKAFRDFTNKSASFASVFTLFLRLRQMCVSPHSVIKTKDKIDNEMVESLPEELQGWITDRNSTAGLYSSKINKAVDIVKEIRRENGQTINDDICLLVSYFTHDPLSQPPPPPPPSASNRDCSGRWSA